MAKFTFPIPGRRNKAAPPPIVSAPLTSKAQKILGSGEISIDSPTLPKDQSKAWDARSTSGISISISESTASHDDRDAGLGTLTEGKVVNGASGRLANFEQESSILPPEILQNGRPIGRMGGLSHNASDARSITDASSLRRRQSTSTIVSFYDAAKVPLSISQQTSNSAMAKGLPPKANALLDIGSCMSEPPREKKKKPARLDFSHLLPRSRSSNAAKNMVLGADLMTRSPSIMSISPNIGRPSTPPVVERRPRRKLTKESLREARHVRPASSQGVSRLPGEMYNDDAVNELSHHYSQATLRGATLSDRRNTRPAQDQSPSFHSSPSPRSPRSPHSPSTRGYLTPFSDAPAHTTYLDNQPSIGNLSGTETPITAIMSPPSVQSPTDCGASISSRHTRTSKASKRTDQSMTELDLQQNSVLSLSSDSEDDFPPGKHTSLTSTGPRSPTESVSRSNYQSSPRSRSSSNTNPSMKRPTSSATSQYLTIPENHATTSRTLPISARSSSLSSALTTSTPSSRKLSGHSTSSGVSMHSVSTGNSAHTAANDFAVHEARAITLVPAQVNRYNNTQHHQSYDAVGSEPSSLPALSPSSVDFYLHSERSSMQDNDQTSVRSSRSMGSGGGNGDQSARSNSGRFMAVTRQEEMLLAALRMKRARMRENIIAQFEEEQEQGGVEARSKGHQQQLSQRSSADTITESLKPRTYQPGGSVTRGSREGSRSRAPAPTSAYARPESEGGKGERILMCFDKPVQNSGHLALSSYDAAEPSPDLSDFMDYDDTNSSDSYPFHTPDYSPLGPGGGAAADHQLGPRPVPRGKRETSRHRHHHESAHKRAGSARPAREDVHVRIVEDPVEMITVDGGRGLMRDDDLGGIPEEADVPRPDSPSVGMPMHHHGGGSPEAALPRKKAVRISAVGRPGVAGGGWWGHDG